MPKDPKKNVDRFKVRGGEINEYDFARQQKAVAEGTKSGGKMSKPKATKSGAKKTGKKAR